MENFFPLITAYICNSNMFVPYVLTELLTYQDKKFLVMSDVESIVMFFRELQLENTDVLMYKQSTLGNICKTRHELEETTKNYNLENIVFFHTEFGGIINWFLAKKSHTTNILFCKIFDRMPYPKSYSIRAFKCWIVNLLLTNDNVEVLDRGTSLVPSLRPSFYRRIRANDYNIKVNYKLINDFLSKKNVGGSRKTNVLLLTGSTVASGIVDEEEYLTKTNLIIEKIGSDNITAKCHPRFSDVFGKEKELLSLPKHIPGNLLIDNYDIFIGNHSTLIAEAAMAGKLAISLLDFYKQNNLTQTKGFKSLFEERLQGRGTIYFPKTIEEILSLVNSI